MRLRPESLSFTVLLGMFAGLPALSIDLSAPTLALLPAALDTDVTMAGLSLTLFMIGFAFGQFVGGRTSDRLGRHPVLLVALLVYAASGIAAGLSGSGAALILARCVQGGAAGACSVQASAIVQDVFRGETAREKQSYVTGVFAVLPMLAPALGTLMIAAWGWRSVHVVLAIAGLLLALVVLCFVEETKADLAAPGVPRSDNRAMRSMLRDPWFRLVAAVNALSYGTLFAYIAGGPFVVMTQMGYSASVYAAIFASTALALSVGSWTSALLGRRGLGACNLVPPGLLLLAGGSLIFAVACAGARIGGVGLIMPPLLVVCFARGLISPNLVYLAISSQREHAGSASALLGLSQLLVGALASAVVAALLARYGIAGLAAPMTVLACVSTVLWLSLARSVKRARPEPLVCSRDT